MEVVGDAADDGSTVRPSFRFAPKLTCSISCKQSSQHLRVHDMATFYNNANSLGPSVIATQRTPEHQVQFYRAGSTAAQPHSDQTTHIVSPPSQQFMGGGPMTGFGYPAVSVISQQRLYHVDQAHQLPGRLQSAGMGITPTMAGNTASEVALAIFEMEQYLFNINIVSEVMLLVAHDDVAELFRNPGLRFQSSWLKNCWRCILCCECGQGAGGASNEPWHENSLMTIPALAKEKKPVHWSSALTKKYLTLMFQWLRRAIEIWGMDGQAASENLTCNRLWVTVGRNLNDVIDALKGFAPCHFPLCCCYESAVFNGQASIAKVANKIEPEVAEIKAIIKVILSIKGNAGMIGTTAQLKKLYCFDTIHRINTYIVDTLTSVRTCTSSQVQIHSHISGQRNKT